MQNSIRHDQQPIDLPADAAISTRDALVAAVGFRPGLDLLDPKQTQASLESKEVKNRPGNKYYGSLPHYSDLEQHLRGVLADLDSINSALGIPSSAILDTEKRSLLTYRLK